MFNIELSTIDQLYEIYYKLSVVNYIKNLIQLDIDEKYINTQNVESIRLETTDFLLREENKYIMQFREFLDRIEILLSQNK